MSSANLYRALMELLPEPPLQVATVASIDYASGTSAITWPGGDVQTVRGTSVAIGSNVFVRSEVIEGKAPSLEALTIEV
jgi:hypothetical protein